MSHNHRQIFAEESDAGSVATNSTDASEELESYSVEKILAEDPNHDDVTGNLYYLLKWVGYPLSRATWEPRANIDDPVLIVNWEKEKQDFRAGRSQPFDVNVYDDAFTDYANKKVERHRLRKEKRRKRGESVSSEANEFPEGSDAEDCRQEDGRDRSGAVRIVYSRRYGRLGPLHGR